MAYCHRNCITHGDIKPENFVFTARNAFSELKLIDFGISIRIDGIKKGPGSGGAGGGSTAAVGSVRGSLPYMAPEMLQAAEP